MKFKEFLKEMSLRDLNKAEAEIDTIYRVVGADVNFTRHFMNRVLDQGESGRFEYDDNQKPRDTDVTAEELVKVFSKFWKDKGRILALQLRKDPRNFEFVLKDISTSLNIPIAVSVDKGKRVVELDCKTLMRKKNFQTGNQKVISIKS